MSIPALCNAGCQQQFTVTGFEIEQMHDGIEKTYFDCPHCKHRYVAYYTDPEIRRLQANIRNLQDSIQASKGMKLIEKNKLLMNELRKRMEDGDCNDQTGEA
ncbi:hypothetical protein MKY59_21080 [Paenibacillus sp. FSL W8-0426]|uniref:hypothetical protein n=1 Tax=Paenibacillus sp. FSL W8-0426 TaxID=2921714 RepID=UPI0030DD9C39